MTLPEEIPTVRILGIDFYNGSLDQALEIAHKQGGLILAPSGPGLAQLGRNSYYDAALQQADLNLIDSGYMALLWKRKTGQRLQRHSGFKFIQALTKDECFQASLEQFWVMPSSEAADSARYYLNARGQQLKGEHFYIAPYYNREDVKDATLLASIRMQRPRYIILCIAGGKQEVLGHWLREQLDYEPAIICIGAAIAFLTGQQANIPRWADRIYIGWFLRILNDPKTFFPRYWKARKLGRLINHYGERRPYHSNEHC